MLFSDILVLKQVERTMDFRFLAAFCIIIVVYKQFLVYHSFNVPLCDVKLTLDYDSDIIWLKKVPIPTQNCRKWSKITVFVMF